MEFEALLRQRQSCRNFDPARVPEKEVLLQVLEAARLSPSACNSQPYHFTVALGDKAAAVAKLTQGMGMNKFTDGCPCFFVVTQRPYNRSAAIGAKFKRQDYRLVDIGIAAANAANRAADLGLATCILGWFDEAGLQALLNTQDRVHLVLAVGYAMAGDPLREKKRKAMDELVSFL